MFEDVFKEQLAIFVGDVVEWLVSGIPNHQIVQAALLDWVEKKLITDNDRKFITSRWAVSEVSQRVDMRREAIRAGRCVDEVSFGIDTINWIIGFNLIHLILLITKVKIASISTNY
jgi:hypothetical protein